MQVRTYNRVPREKEADVISQEIIEQGPLGGNSETR